MNCHSQAMAKGKGKDKGKSKLRGQHALVCWTCGKSGHVASQCPPGRVSALDENAQFEVEELGDQGWLEDDWSADTWSEDWWSDDLVAAVFGVELGMMIGGGRLGMMVGLILLGVLFSLLLLRRPLLLLHRLQEHQ